MAATKSRKRLTVAEACEELGDSRSTSDEWRKKTKGARCTKLPNGEIRARRAELDRWLDPHEGAV